MVVKIIKKIKAKTYHCEKGPEAYAKKIGVNILGDIHLYGHIAWSTEPWIITLGNNVHIIDGVKFITHDGGTLLFRHLVRPGNYKTYCCR